MTMIKTRTVNRETWEATNVADTEVSCDLTDDPWCVLLAFHDDDERERLQWRVSRERLGAVLGGERYGPGGDVFMICIGPRFYITLVADGGRWYDQRVTMVMDRDEMIAALAPSEAAGGAAEAAFDWDHLVHLLETA